MPSIVSFGRIEIVESSIDPWPKFDIATAFTS